MQKLELSIFLRHMIVKSYLIKYLIAKAKKRKTRRLYGHNLSHLFHGDLGLWPCLNQMKILKTLRPLPLPVPSPVCTEWLLPTQVSCYFGLKLSFAPNFRNSISMYSLPNKNSRKLTPAEGPHENAQWEYQREVPRIHLQGHRIQE